MPKLEMSDREDYLSHEGILGMHWGERRYQNYDGSLTEEGRKHYGIGRPRMSKAEKLEMRQKKQEERQEKKAEAIRKKKEKVYIRGNADEIYKNRKLFTTEEYQKAMQRAQEFTKYEEAKKQKNAKPAKPAKVDDGKMHAFQLYTGDAETAKGVDKKKQAIINSGDPKLVRKNLSKLNDQELRSALEHIKGRTEIDSKIPGTKEYKDLEKAVKDRKVATNGKSAVDALTNMGKSAATLFGTTKAVYNGYNDFASIVNELSGSDKLPTFKQNPWNEKQSNYGSTTVWKTGKPVTVNSGLDATGKMTTFTASNGSADINPSHSLGFNVGTFGSNSNYTIANAYKAAEDTTMDEWNFVGSLFDD